MLSVLKSLCNSSLEWLLKPFSETPKTVVSLFGGSSLYMIKCSLLLTHQVG